MAAEGFNITDLSAEAVATGDGLAECGGGEG